MPRVVIALATVLVAATGCAHHTAADTRAVVAYHPGGRAETTAVPATGVYALGRGPGEPAVKTRYLVAGAAVGFERSVGGELRAVAGQERLPLPDEAYQWAVDPNGTRRVREQDAQAAAAAAYRKYDQVTDKVGAVLYPPLYVVSLPFHVLAGGQGGRIY